MNARRVLILLTALGFVFAPLAAALPSGRAAEAAAGAPQALPSGRTGEAPAKPETKPEVKAEAAQAAQAQAPAQKQAAAPAKPAGAAAAKPAAKKAPAARTEPIIPAFQSPKEKTAVFVFYVWLWLSIGVLIYFLRWWVQEADRIFRAKFYEPAESPRKDNPLPPLLGE